MTRDGSGTGAPPRPSHRGPPPLSLRGAVLAGGATAVVASVSADALVLALAGLVVFLAGLTAHRRVGVLVGALGLFGGVLLAGAAGAPVSRVLVGVAGAIVAWDAGDNALSLGAQVGRRSRSARNELVHLGATVGVAGLTAGAGYGVFRLATGGQPVTALFLLLLAAALVIAALSES